MKQVLTEEPPGQKGSSFLGKGSRVREDYTEGLLLEPRLKGRAAFVRQEPPVEAPPGVAAAVLGKAARCVPEATSPQVLGTGRGGGTPLGAGGEVVTCCSKVISRASLLSHSPLCGPSVPRWLSRAGPSPSAGPGRGAACCSLWPASPPSSAGLNFTPQSGIVFLLILVIL